MAQFLYVASVIHLGHFKCIHIERSFRDIIKMGRFVVKNWELNVRLYT